LHLRAREWCAFDEDGGQRERSEESGGRARHQDVVLGVGYPYLGQGLAGRGHEPGGAVRGVFVVDLTELGGEHAVGGEVLQRPHDGVGGVEVALGQDKGARRRGIRRRVAVGGRVPDQVVSLVAPGHERPAVRIEVGDGGILGEVAVVVGERRGHERVRDRVELDGVDVVGPEPQ
jgi:hypothetical protein